MPDLNPADLPRRVAEVTHALMEAWTQAGGSVPVTTSEVMVYDWEALTLGSTSSALFRAMRRYRLADRAGHGLWFPTSGAWEMRNALDTLIAGGPR